MTISVGNQVVVVNGAPSHCITRLGMVTKVPKFPYYKYTVEMDDGTKVELSETDLVRFNSDTDEEPPTTHGNVTIRSLTRQGWRDYCDGKLK